MPENLSTSAVTMPSGASKLTGSIPVKDSKANETSLLSANITEEDVKLAITEAIKKPEEAKKPDQIAEEIAQLKIQLAEVTKKLEESSKELTEFRKAKEEAAIIEKNSKIKERKDQLGEFAKDMKDEDILDELKFENARLKKENADLKAGKKPEEASIKKITPEIGAEDKNTSSKIIESAKKVEKYFMQELGHKEEQK